MQLHTKILIGLLLGGFAGLTANLLELGWLEAFLVALEPIGTAFIRGITMVIIPLVVASLVIGTASLGDLSRLGRIGGKTLAYYLVTTAIAVTIGLVVGNLLAPGRGIQEGTRDALAAGSLGAAEAAVNLAEATPSPIQTLLAIIPRNPVQAAAELNLLSLIFFTVVFGAALSVVAPRPREAVLTFFEGVNEASMVVIGWVMKLAPVAVFALIAGVVARFGMDLLQSLLMYALAVILGLTLHLILTYGVAIRFLAGLPFLPFLREIARAPLVALSTASSSATLPVTLKVAQEGVGISRPVSSFVLPLGATINMDGTALYQAVAVLFIAQIYGIDLTIGQQLLVVLTATLASIGTAGVPSAGLIMLVIVLNAVGLGPHVQAGIALILGIDRPIDMLRTSMNVTGDLTAAAVVARSEGEELTLGGRPLEL